MASYIAAKVDEALHPRGSREGYEQLPNPKVKFYLDRDDKEHKIAEITDITTARSLCEELAKQCGFTYQNDWAIKEHLVDLNLERSLEDHELILPIYNGWGEPNENSNNKFRFMKDAKRYGYILNKNYFDPQIASPIDPKTMIVMRHVAKKIQRQHLRKTCLEYANPPILSGELERRQCNSDNFDHEHILLDACIMYFAKSPVPEDFRDKDKMTKLLKIQNFDIYIVLDGNRIFKAYNNNYLICLKRCKAEEDDDDIQFHYFACEDDSTRQRWMTGMRMAKYGLSLYKNTTELRRTQPDSSPHPVEDEALVCIDYSSGTGRIVSDPLAIEVKSLENSTLIGGGLLFKVNSAIHHSMAWFHPHLTKDRAIERLSKHKNKDGVFLVRMSNAEERGLCVLAYTFQRKIVAHFIHKKGHTEIVKQKYITKKLNRMAYHLEGATVIFYDLIQLVEFYHLNSSGLRTKLSHFIGPSRDTALFNRIKNYKIPNSEFFQDSKQKELLAKLKNL